MKTPLSNFHQFGIIISAFLLFASCSSDDYPGNQEFVAAFQKESENFTGDSITKEIKLVFSTEAEETGAIEISYSTAQLLYGQDEDFYTDPPATDEIITIPIEKGSRETTFKVTKSNETFIADDFIQFSIVKVDLNGKNAFTQGNTDTKIFFTETASLGGTIYPEVGGPNEPNQVYINLSTEEETKVRRDSWDLGFYSGQDFHVKLNSSMYMFAGALATTDIDQVSADEISDLQSKMDFLVEESNQFVDHPDGDLDKLIINNISENDEENPVYLVKMGQEIGTETPSSGSVAVAGDNRGWKKIRVLQNGTNYILQYADLEDDSHQEITIPKNPTYNFSFYSIQNEEVVEVEPPQNNWDLNFTVNIEIEELPGTNFNTAYGYSDYVTTNTLGNVKAYQVSTEDYSYDEFTKSNVSENELVLDQRIIGSSWRNTVPPDRGVSGSVFYVIQDTEGHLYKLKFTAFENENGVRGYPKFKYKLLN